MAYNDDEREHRNSIVSAESEFHKRRLLSGALISTYSIVSMTYISFLVIESILPTSVIGVPIREQILALSAALMVLLLLPAIRLIFKERNYTYEMSAYSER